MPRFKKYCYYPIMHNYKSSFSFSWSDFNWLYFNFSPSSPPITTINQWNTPLNWLILQWLCNFGKIYCNTEWIFTVMDYTTHENSFHESAYWFSNQAEINGKQWLSGTERKILQYLKLVSKNVKLRICSWRAAKCRHWW